MHTRILSLLPSTSLVHGLAISKLSFMPATITNERTYRTLRPASTKFTRDLKELYQPISPDDERAFLRIEPPSGLDTPVVYRNLLVDRFIRTWMRRGELALYQQMFNDTMYEVKRRQYSRWRKAMAKGGQEAVNIIHGIGLFFLL